MFNVAVELMSSLDEQRLLSIVVIGLNEQERLKASLEAAVAFRPVGYDLEVLYVDSGSTDRSVAIASAVPGVRVLCVNGSRRSAAIARNVGLRQARGLFVQLVDGDSVLQPGWMDAALAVLNETPAVACVFGRCTEMFPDQSVYMRVCGLDWHMEPGDRRTCGGNSMWRMSVIAAHGYFDEQVRIGEEPDLCYRVRQAGGRIVCVDAPMVMHDLGMLHFGQYWRRAVNAGWGYAVIAARYWRRPEKLWLREAALNFAEPASWLGIFTAGWGFAGVLGGSALLLAWWLLRTLQIANTVKGRGLQAADALMYGVHCQFVRLPVAVGQLRALFGLR